MSAVEMTSSAGDAPGQRGPDVSPPPGIETTGPFEPAQTETNARLRNTIDLRQNRTAAWLTGLLAAVVCVLFAGLWLGHFAKTETARGIISATGGFSRLDAPRAGIIKEVYVSQGDTVAAGTPIYMLRFGEAGSGGETAVATDIRTSLQTRANLVTEVERARTFIAQIRDQQIGLRNDQAALIAAIDNQEKSIQNALAQAREKVQRVRKLVQQGYATRDLFDTYERTYFEYERQLTEVRLKRVEYRRQDSEKQRELSTLLAEKENQRASAENQINTIDGQVTRLRTESALQVQAQSSGQVLAITAKVGDSVDAGQFVAAVGDPDAEPLIVLDAPARATGLIKVGQKVILKYDAFPFKTFGIHDGTVTAISSAAIRAPGTQGDTGLDPRPVERQSLYRIEVKPDSNEIDAYGEKKRLKIGSTLSADIVVERRRLIDWVLDPIRAMRGRT
jgi:membrane fusion protein